MASRISILGCGWLGFPLAAALVKAGTVVMGSTTTEEKYSQLQSAGIVPYVLRCVPDLRGEKIEEFFQSDILIITVPFKRDLKDPREYKKQIDNIIVRLPASPVKFVLFTSSTSVYPRQTALALEDQPFEPDNLRSRVLLKVEQDLMSNRHFKSTIIRFAGLYGGTRNVGRFLAGQSDLTGGEEPVNLIHLDDCVQIIIEVVRQGAWGEIFNACADQHPTRRELYTAAAKPLGLRPPTFAGESQESRKVVSNQKIRQRLNYRFQHPNPLEL